MRRFFGVLINEVIPLQGETDEAEFKWSFIATKESLNKSP
jgi:hypothetical protein